MPPLQAVETFLSDAGRMLQATTSGKFDELLRSIVQPSPFSYFYWLIGLSLFFWALEVLKPWRIRQPAIRKDFWLDAWYMFFNLFVFPVLGFAALSALAEWIVLSAFGIEGRDQLSIFSVAHWPAGLQMLVLFVARDFVQWCVHVLLHRVPWLWEFHKIHHSVEQMGFAAHLRYHWMENVVYRMLEYFPLAFLGFAPINFFIVYITSLAIGHFNHANVRLPLGPLRYIFNSPQMHIWHHTQTIPGGRRYGVNYGLSLSVWDYLFGTAVVPGDGRDEVLGFPGRQVPENFFAQAVYPLQAMRRDSDGGARAPS